MLPDPSTGTSERIVGGGLNDPEGVCGPPGGAFLIVSDRGDDRNYRYSPTYPSFAEDDRSGWREPRDGRDCVVNSLGTEFYVTTTRGELWKCDLTVSPMACALFLDNGNCPCPGTFDDTAGVTLSPDDRTLYYANQRDENIHSIDLATLTCNWVAAGAGTGYRDGRAALAEFERPQSVSAAYDGECLYVSSRRAGGGGGTDYAHIRKLHFPNAFSSTLANAPSTGGVSATVPCDRVRVLFVLVLVHRYDLLVSWLQWWQRQCFLV
jgi:DNA-binding beta-propeller fold protein YncE